MPYRRFRLETEQTEQDREPLKFKSMLGKSVSFTSYLTYSFGLAFRVRVSRESSNQIRHASDSVNLLRLKNFNQIMGENLTLH